jgi:hypothetical protein
MTSLFPRRESLVCDIPAGDGNIEKLLYSVESKFMLRELLCILQVQYSVIMSAAKNKFTLGLYNSGLEGTQVRKNLFSRKKSPLARFELRTSS